MTRPRTPHIHKTRNPRHHRRITTIENAHQPHRRHLTPDRLTPTPTTPQTLSALKHPQRRQLPHRRRMNPSTPNIHRLRMNSRHRPSRLRMNSRHRPSRLRMNSRHRPSRLRMNSRHRPSRLRMNSRHRPSRLRMNSRHRPSRLRMNSRHRPSRLRMNSRHRPSRHARRERPRGQRRGHHHRGLQPHRHPRSRHRPRQCRPPHRTSLAYGHAHNNTPPRAAITLPGPAAPSDRAAPDNNRIENASDRRPRNAAVRKRARRPPRRAAPPEADPRGRASWVIRIARCRAVRSA